MDVSADQLQRAVEGQHGGKAVLMSAEPVKETFQGKTVWEGVVHVFDLEGHPKATRAYAWSSPIEGSDKRRFYAVLHLGGIRSPVDAVRAAIVAEQRAAVRKASATTEAETRRDADVRDILGMGRKK
jgi:hypothetical protein